MRLIDADKLLEHVGRERLDSRELIAKMIESSPTIDKVWVVSYYDEGEAPVVTVYNNENAAYRHSYWELQIGSHSKVDMDECPIYSSFTINGK